jgi:CHAT domain-containing protein
MPSHRPLLLLLLLLALPLLAHAGSSPQLDAAHAAWQARDLPTALVQYRLALRAAQQAGDQAGEAECMAGMGRVHRSLGRHADAIGWFEDALALDKRLGLTAAVAADHGELGLSYLALGDLKEARKRLRKSFDSYQLAGDPVGAADALVNLGLAERRDHQLERALELLQTAETLYRSADRIDGVGDALTNQGGVLADLGRYGAAIEAQRSAIEAFDAASDPTGRGAALHNMGNLYAELGDYDRAAGLYRQSRTLLTAPADLAIADLALGGILMAAGDASGAKAVYEAALQVATTVDAPGIALNLGQALLALGDASALDRFEQAASLAEASGDQPTRVAALLAVGEAQLASGRAETAFATFKRCGALARDLGIADLSWRAWHGIGRASRARGADGLAPLRNAVSSLEESRRGLEGLDPWAVRHFVADRRQVYLDLVDALLASGDGASALLYTERLRVAEMNAGGATTDPVEQQYRALAGREADLQGAIQSAQRAPEGSRDAERIAALREELARTRVEFSRYVDELRGSYADFDRLVKVDPSDIESYQRDLADDEVVIQPVALPDRLAILVFASGGLGYREVTVTQEELDQRIGRVLRVMRSRRLKNPERLMEHLDVLGSWLWEPVAADLVGKKRVIVAADGALRYLPFQLLRREGRFLVEDVEVVNVTNVGSLKRRAGEELRLAAGGLLALGNPDGTLPAADVEIDALAALFPGARALHGPQATLASLTREVAGRQVLHLATHGVLDAEAPERSHIVLAPPEGGSAEQGHLGYLEIPGLYGPLQDTGMVVLSACETAVPLAPQGDDVQGGGQEIAGLANQFRRAGVPRLMASLWQVSDESTRALMVRFYQALGEGRAPPEALAVAQRALLADPEMQHPFYWAPFILIGTPH